MTETKSAWSWRHAFSASDLPATTKHVLHTLGMFMNELGEGCYPSVADICRYSGLDKKTVIKHLAAARERGWIDVSQHGYRGQKWKRQQYAARWPQRDLTAPCPPDDVDEGGGAVPPPFETGEAVDFAPEGGGTEGSKVVEQVHQDKTSPVTTPRTSPVEREAREGGQEEEAEPTSRKAIERAFERAWQAWPTSISDSRPDAWKAWQALSAADREAAATDAARYFEAVKAVGRKKLCSHAVYLREKRWAQLPAQAATAKPDVAAAAPFGKAGGAYRMAKLLAGPEAGARIPDLTAVERHLVDNGTTDERTLRREKVARWGYPTVNRLHEVWGQGRSLSLPARFEALGAGFEQVRVGGDVWAAWKDEHEKRGWPWLPDPGRQGWVYFPPGGPEGLRAFEAAVQASGDEGDDGGARQAAE